MNGKFLFTASAKLNLNQSIEHKSERKIISRKVRDELRNLFGESDISD